MMCERFKLPPPWHSIELLGMLEPVRRTDTDIVLRHRLYLVNPLAEGGRTVLKDGPEVSWPLRPVSGSVEVVE